MTLPPIKKVEETLRESEERFNLVLDAAPRPRLYFMTMWDRLSTLIPPLPTCLAGKKRSGLGKRIDFVPEESQAGTKAAIERMIREHQVQRFETQRYTKDGRILDIHISGAIFKDKDGDGESVGSVIFLHDITEQKQAQRDLQESYALYQTSLDALPQQYFRKDMEGRRTYANKAHLEAIGMTLEECVGKTDEEIHGFRRVNRQIQSR